MKFLISILVLGFTLGAFAGDSSSGCGPGWYIAKKNSLLSSSIRGTTNGILAPTVTLGMTFGTSKCSKHSIVKNEVEDLKFATDNYFEIAADTAKGEGEFLTAYSELMGCHGVHSKRFKNKMKSNFKKLFNFNEVKPEELVKETYKTILTDQELFKACFAV